MALLPEYIPERDRAAGILKVAQAELLDALLQLGIVLPGLADARQIALHVRSKHWHAGAAESLSHYLQRDSLAGTGGSGNQPVTVRHHRQEVEFVVTLGNQKWV